MTKKILVTSGGTIIRIDDVRFIGNSGSGTFLSKIAESALSKGYEVIFLYAKNSRLPFSDIKSINIHEAALLDKDELSKRSNKVKQFEKNLRLVEFRTYDDYAKSLEDIIKAEKPDVVFLGAAVSDYGTDKVDGKISSDLDKITIELQKVGKLIKVVHEYADYPVFQIGFKLLSSVSEDELFNVAYESGIKSHSNLTIANDLEKIRQGHREVLIVTPEKGKIKLSEPDLAKKVFEFAEKRFNGTYFLTKTEVDTTLADRYFKEYAQIKSAVTKLFQENLLEEFYNDSGLYHGSVSIRVDNGFLITGRASDKSNITDDDIVFVGDVDMSEKVIYTKSTSGKKASMNALLSYLIFKKYPNINAIVHTHQQLEGVLATGFPYTPGTLEYSDAPLQLLDQSRTINLVNHGQLTIGNNLEEAIEYVRNKVNR